MREDLSVGVDLGGTKLHVGLVDATGRIVASRVERTCAHEGPGAVVEAIAALAEQVSMEAGARGCAIGVGVAGQVLARSGVLRAGPNLPGWKDVPLGALLEERLGVPAVIGNDLTFITLGEWKFGAGRGLHDLVVIFVGTGVGGGIVSGGRLLLGADGYAGELGHVRVAADGRRCHCGGQGCLEAYVSGWALAEQAFQRCRAEPELGRSFLAAAGCDAQQITGAAVGIAYGRGDPLARALVEDASRFLGAALAGMSNALNPHRIILGGGVIDGIPDLATAAARVARAEALLVLRDGIEVVRSALGSDAGVIGASVRARELSDRGSAAADGTDRMR